MRSISFTTQAYTDYLDWLATDKKSFLEITSLIKETARNPESGSGKPEQLKHELSGLWSGRINHEHRLVYRINGDTIEVISCKYHYSR